VIVSKRWRAEVYIK